MALSRVSTSRPLTLRRSSSSIFMGISASVRHRHTQHYSGEPLTAQVDSAFGGHGCHRLIDVRDCQQRQRGAEGEIAAVEKRASRVKYWGLYTHVAVVHQLSSGLPEWQRAHPGLPVSSQPELDGCMSRFTGKSRHSQVRREGMNKI